MMTALHPKMATTTICLLVLTLSTATAQGSWMARLAGRPGGEQPHAILLDGDDGQIELETDLGNSRQLENFPLILGDGSLDLEDEPIQIIQQGNQLFAAKLLPQSVKRAMTVTEKRAPTVTDKRAWTVTDKRAPTVTDKRFTVTDKRFTVTDKRAPTVTDKRFTVTDKRAPTVTDKRFTVTDKRAPTVTDKRFTVTDKRAPTVTDKRFTVTDKRAPTVTDKRFTVTDERKRGLMYLKDLLDNMKAQQERRDAMFDNEFDDTPLQLPLLSPRCIDNQCGSLTSEHTRSAFMDGWLHKDGDDYFVESVPTEDGNVEHVVTKRANPRLADERSWIPGEQYQTDYLSASQSMEGFLRERRRSDGPIKAMVDILVVVDNALWRRALAKYRNRAKPAAGSLKKYYALVFSLVNARYQNIRDPELSITVRVAGIYLAEKREDSPWSERITYPSPRHPGEVAIDPDKALNGLKDWLLEQSDLPPYDHAMGFTGYHMVRAQGGIPTAGMAFTKSICNTATGYSTSVVEENGGFANIGTAAHELGHSLGAEHDGFEENRDCAANHNYIMAPAAVGEEEYLKNFYHFSRCSVRQLKEFLGGEQASCLLDNLHHTVKTEKVGKIMDADGQCKDIYGHKSGLCPFKELQEMVCAQLWCRSPEKEDGCTTLMPLSAIYGTPCGDGKICKFGECIDESAADSGGRKSQPKPYAPPRRPARPPPSRTVQQPHRATGTRSCTNDQNEGYCRQLVSQRLDACNQESIRGYCCYTCNYYGR